VPKDPTDPPITHGPACDSCTTPVPALAVTLTDSSGHFVLEDVPTGGDIPLVIQVGKWRRRTTIPAVLPCQDNPITDAELTRLPRNQSEGSLPKIAFSTGHSDALECLLRKIGIDDQEFSTDAEGGSVHMFQGCIDDAGDAYGAGAFAPNIDSGATFPSVTQMFDNNELANYDMILFSCEGHSCSDIQTSANISKLEAFEDTGGRVFLDHIHFRWISQSDSNIQDAETDFSAASGKDPPPAVATIDQSFPKGMAFAEWLQAVGATSAPGMITITKPQTSGGVVHPPLAQRWIYSDTPADNFYVTINTPVPAADAIPDGGAPVCGRVVHTDLHVSNSGDSSTNLTPFPGSCTSTTLTPEEKALEFMIFDLSSCVQKEDQVPEPPPK
ncbi:MAG TPA: carboxypeptidase regulatory-like domain-containing protein, partial [Polyangiaceae bacterium]